MAESAAQAVAPEALTSGARPSRVSTSLRRSLRWLGVAPFGVYVALGLLAPFVAIAIAAFRNSSTGAFTLSNFNTALHGTYLLGLKTSLLLSVATAIVPGIFGLLVAYAIFTAKRGNVLRQVVITASGVFANFGGVPLAILFIATLSTTGVVTGWIKDLTGVDIWDHGFTLYSAYPGVFIVYMYFQIPLMVLVILPALEGLRPAWREAAENMGAADLALLALRGRPGAAAVVPRLPAAAVRQRLLRVRHRRGAHRRHGRADARSRSGRC